MTLTKEQLVATIEGRTAEHKAQLVYKLRSLNDLCASLLAVLSGPGLDDELLWWSDHSQALVGAARDVDRELNRLRTLMLLPTKED